MNIRKHRRFSKQSPPTRSKKKSYHRPKENYSEAAVKTSRGGFGKLAAGLMLGVTALAGCQQENLPEHVIVTDNSKLDVLRNPELVLVPISEVQVQNMDTEYHLTKTERFDVENGGVTRRDDHELHKTYEPSPHHSFGIHIGGGLIYDLNGNIVSSKALQSSQSVDAIVVNPEEAQGPDWTLTTDHEFSTSAESIQLLDFKRGTDYQIVMTPGRLRVIDSIGNSIEATSDGQEALITRTSSSGKSHDVLKMTENHRLDLHDPGGTLSFSTGLQKSWRLVTEEAVPEQISQPEDNSPVRFRVGDWSVANVFKDGIVMDSRNDQETYSFSGGELRTHKDIQVDQLPELPGS